MAGRESESLAFDLPPYSRAAHFEDELASRRAYVRLTSVLLDYPRIDLSFTRLLLETGYHVAIVGAPTRPAVDRAIRRQLEPGATVSLTPLLLGELWRRHCTTMDFSPWMERHYLHL
jgi:hypothetical protein